MAELMSIRDAAAELDVSIQVIEWQIKRGELAFEVYIIGKRKVRFVDPEKVQRCGNGRPRGGIMLPEGYTSIYLACKWLDVSAGQLTHWLRRRQVRSLLVGGRRAVHLEDARQAKAGMRRNRVRSCDPAALPLVELDPLLSAGENRRRIVEDRKAYCRGVLVRLLTPEQLAEYDALNHSAVVTRMFKTSRSPVGC